MVLDGEKKKKKATINQVGGWDLGATEGVRWKGYPCTLLHAATVHAALIQGVLATLKAAACNSLDG